MHLTPINIQIVAVKWLSQGWGGSLWQSRVPGALCACLNTGVIFYWQGAASRPPVVARLWGCQKVCVCVFVCFSMGSIRRKYPSSPETRGIPEWKCGRPPCPAADLGRCLLWVAPRLCPAGPMAGWGLQTWRILLWLCLALCGEKKGGKISCMAACSWCVDFAW